MTDQTIEMVYDRDRDIVTINGVKYAGAFFRSFGIHGAPVGSLLRIIKRDDGTLTVEKFAPGETVIA